MGCDDTDVAARRPHHSLEPDTRHARNARVEWIRQQVVIHLAHRKARKNHVAKTAAPPVVAGMIDRDTRDRDVSGRERSQRGELIFAGAAAEARVRIVVGDFLEAQHVEVGEPLRLGYDPRRVDPFVDTPAPLHIPRNELHRGRNATR